MPDKTDGTPVISQHDVRWLGAALHDGVQLTEDELRPTIEAVRDCLLLGGTVDMASAGQQPLNRELAYALACTVHQQDVRNWARDAEREGFDPAVNRPPRLLSFLRNVKIKGRYLPDAEWIDAAVEAATTEPRLGKVLADMRAQIAEEDAAVTAPQLFPPTAPYFALAPADTARVRRELAGWLAGPDAYESYSDGVRTGRQEIMTKTMTYSADPAALLQQEEHATVANAPLYYVDADSCQLTAAELPGMPQFVPMMDDLPSKTGFVLFEQPLAQYFGQLFAGQEHVGITRDGQVVDLSQQLRDHPVQVMGASWRLTYDSWRQRERFTGGCFWITFYVFPPARVMMLPGQPHRAVWQQEAERWPAIAPDMEAVVGLYDPRVMEGSAEEYLDAVPDQPGMAQWIKALFAVFMLNRQKGIGERETVRTPARKLPKSKAKSSGQKQIPAEEIQVLRLRRSVKVQRDTEAPEGMDEKATRQYRVRWTVRSFWRQQYYPSLGTHRPVLVPKHLKGPEGAPFKVPRDVVRVVSPSGK